MEKKLTKILLAVDESKGSENAVKYATMMTSAIKDINYTLFTLESWIPDILIRGGKTDPEAKAQVDQLIRENRKEAGLLIQHLKDFMVRNGVHESRIETVAQLIDQGIAKDILARAEETPHDAIVISKRGLTPSKDFFVGTIASKIVEHALGIPVWIIDEEIDPTNVLLPVDGSEISLKTVKYVFDMIGGHPDAKITLFHVLPRLRHYFSIPFENEYPYLQAVLQREDQHRMERFHKKAGKLLKGRSKPQLDIKLKRYSYDISTAILDEARTGRYGTVIVGRRGERGAFFAGTVPMRLVQKLSGPALWVVP